jgi:Na+-driven multidrug efflux pump
MVSNLSMELRSNLPLKIQNTTFGNFSVLRGLVFLLIGVTVLPIFIGINGVWAAIPLAELLVLGVALLLIHRTYKKLFSHV